MKKIPLTRGQYALVDDEDFERLNQHKWHAKWCAVSKSYYAMRTERIKGGGFIKVTMSREIIECKDMQVDHKNHNTLDNQRHNLRRATPTQNQANQRLRNNNVSGFKGVSFHKATNKWRAYVTINQKQMHLGIFTDAVEAAKAYNEAANKYFGEYALLNNVAAI